MRKLIMSMMIALGCVAATAVFAQEESVSIAGSEETQSGSDEVAVDVSENTNSLHEGCGCGKGKSK